MTNQDDGVNEVDRLSAHIAALLARSARGRWDRLIAYGTVTTEYGSVRVDRVDDDGTVAVEVGTGHAQDLVDAFEELHVAWIAAGNDAWQRASVSLDRDGSVELEVEIP